MTQKELEKIKNDCIEIINEVVRPDAITGVIEVKFNKRFTQTLGRCGRRKTTYGRAIAGHLVQISEKYYTHHSTTDDERYSLMLHELLHSVKGCNNHGKLFNHYASLLEEATGVTQITGATSKTHSEYNKDTRTPFKYILECRECGREHYMKRLRGGKEDGIDWEGDAVHYRCRCEDKGRLRVHVLR